MDLITIRPKYTAIRVGACQCRAIRPSPLLKQMWRVSLSKALQRADANAPGSHHSRRLEIVGHGWGARPSQSIDTATKAKSMTKPPRKPDRAGLTAGETAMFPGGWRPRRDRFESGGGH